MYLLSFKILSVSQGQPNFDHLANLFGCGLSRGIGLTGDQRHGHKGHDSQTNNFVEISITENAC